MFDDFAHEVDYFFDEIRAFQRLMGQAFSKAPSQSEGVHGSGAIRITLDKAGFPATIQVRPDWKDRILPEGLGEAVEETFRIAARERVERWGRALDSDNWQDGFESLRDRLRTSSQSAGPEKLSPAFRRESSPRRSQTVEQVVEDFLGRSDSSKVVAIPKKLNQGATGRDSSRRVAIVLTGNGLHSCVVDASWVASRSGQSLSRSLNEALSSARSTFTASRESKSDVLEMGDLIGRLFETLKASGPSNLPKNSPH